MLNKYYFSYLYFDSIIHKMNSAVKVLIFILSILSLLINNNITLLVVGIILIAKLFLSKVPLLYYLKMTYIFRFVYVIVIIICAIFNVPLSICLSTIAKIIIAILELMLLTYTTSPIEIADGVDVLIKPFNIFFIKTGRLTLSIMLGIKYIPILLSNANKIFQSQSSRGFDYSYRTSLGKFIVIIRSIPQCIYMSGVQKKQIRLNMLMKLYNGNKVRTKMSYDHIGFYDLFLLSIVLINIILYFVGVI